MYTFSLLLATSWRKLRFATIECKFQTFSLRFSCEQVIQPSSSRLIAKGETEGDWRLSRIRKLMHNRLITNQSQTIDSFYLDGFISKEQLFLKKSFVPQVKGHHINYIFFLSQHKIDPSGRIGRQFFHD